MASTRISQQDRLIMGTSGNLEGLKRRFPAFQGVDRAQLDEAIKLVDQLMVKLNGMLGRGSDQTPQQLQQAAQTESSTRAAGQLSRSNQCPQNSSS